MHADHSTVFSTAARHLVDNVVEDNQLNALLEKIKQSPVLKEGTFDRTSALSDQSARVVADLKRVIEQIIKLGDSKNGDDKIQDFFYNSIAGTTSHLATLRELEQRVKSVRNIEKITKSMKMIATTKLNKATTAMQAAKVYGKANGDIFTKSEALAPSGGRELFIVVSSDKGLCGGIHSSVSKRTRAELAK
ncbi:hypothetical protein CF328_g8827, partial [Tilletia controversa]